MSNGTYVSGRAKKMMIVKQPLRRVMTMKIQRTFRPLMAMKPPTMGPLQPHKTKLQRMYLQLPLSSSETYKDGPAKLPTDHKDITIPLSFGAQMSVTMVPLVAIGPLSIISSIESVSQQL